MLSETTSKEKNIYIGKKKLNVNFKFKTIQNIVLT